MNEPTVASFFTGIGGFDLGFERAGFRVVSQSEVKPFSVGILESRWPDVPNLGDLNVICHRDGVHDCPIPRADVWTGGFPCSDLSLAGKRRGLVEGDRSSLGLVFLDLVGRHHPEWVVLENVPGLLSSRAGRDLGTLLRILGDLGYWWAYRVLDAAEFGLAQARRRVIVVASSRPGGPEAVLHRPIDGIVAAAEGRGAGDRPCQTGEDRAGGGEPWCVYPTFPHRPGQQLPHRGDGISYTLMPGTIPYVVVPAPSDSEGMRGSAGISAGLDGSDTRDAEEAWVERLDTARWHVLGRALPPVFAEFVGFGIREVMADKEGDR